MKKKTYFLLMIPFLLFSLVSCTKNYDFTIDVPAEITVGQSVVLKSSTKVLWSVDNQTLASIDGDTLTALKEGTVVLTAKNAKKESKQLTANILIKKKTNTVYEITYQLDGGTLPENAPLTYEETVGLDTLPIPTKENYKFIGWYLNSEKVNIISTTQTGDIILVAVYEREGQNYNITYELDGGTLPENAPTTYTETIGLEELPIPTKQNYKFIGWYLNSEKVDMISPTQTGDIILVAIYEPIGQNYNINYELDGGTLPENAPTTYIETIGIEELPIPTKENYEFAGWYLSTISMAQYTSIDSTSKGDIKFIARWTPLINENEIVLPEAPYHFTKIKKVEHSSGNGTYVYQPDFQGVGVSSTSVLQYDWHSSNESVATISIYSSITARSAGFAIITAVSKTDSNIIINCIIQVSSDGITCVTEAEANNHIVHTVTFVDKDDNIIAIKHVVDGNYVHLPTPPVYEGLRFIGWSHDNYNIKYDLTIKAQYDEGINPYVGKKIAILGDSISTYQGYVPAGYPTFYPYPTGDVNDVNQTWWMQMVNTVGAKLFVNNSYSGSTVATSNVSATQHDTRLATLLIGQEHPDVIIIYMGSNDCGSPYVTFEQFKAAYKVMIDKIKILTPSAEIILATLPSSSLYTDSDRAQYNEAINEYATLYDLKIIDLASIDLKPDLLDSAHPAKSGMLKIANKAIETLIGGRNIPSLTLSGETQLLIGQETTLEVIKQHIESPVSFTSSDETIATVTSEGVVKGLKEGVVEITATCGDLNETITITVMVQSYEVTYDFNGGYSPELFIANKGDAVSLSINNYNYNNGAFWSGRYTSDIFIGTSSYDPKATFSDRIYIQKNEETGLYEIVSFLQSGASSWPTGAEFVITISHSYSGYNSKISPITQTLSVGKIVVFSDDIESISETHPVDVYFFDQVPTANTMTTLVSINDELISPRYLGYSFLGWFDNEDTKYSHGSELTKAITLTAKWE